MVQMLEKGTTYANGNTWDCFLRSLGMCIGYGRRLRPCGASKGCDVACRTCVTDLDTQQSVGDVTLRECVVDKAMVGLQSVGRRRKLIVV